MQRAISQIEKWLWLAWYVSDSAGSQWMVCWSSYMSRARPTSWPFGSRNTNSPNPRFTVTKLRSCPSRLDEPLSA